MIYHYMFTEQSECLILISEGFNDVDKKKKISVIFLNNLSKKLQRICGILWMTGCLFGLWWREYNLWEDCSRNAKYCSIHIQFLHILSCTQSVLTHMHSKPLLKKIYWHSVWPELAVLILWNTYSLIGIVSCYTFSK